MPVRPETRSRALALRLLYAWDVVGGVGDRVARDSSWRRVAALLAAGPAATDRALTLAGLAADRRGEIDAAIGSAASNWKLERLAVIDRNLLRLGIAELLEGKTPPRVVIDEAIRLARWFGGPRTSAFVNGVLDRVARDLGKL